MRVRKYFQRTVTYRTSLVFLKYCRNLYKFYRNVNLNYFHPLVFKFQMVVRVFCGR